jgi:ribulose-5-phosphate 4-epimerase/fuculose-1-phosphate aldolase
MSRVVSPPSAAALPECAQDGWSDLINTRITARVPGPHDLINPYGLLFEEVTASSLVKIDAEGNKVEPSNCEINSGGFAMPSAVHMARPDLVCVLHTHSITGAPCRCRRMVCCRLTSMRCR